MRRNKTRRRRRTTCAGSTLAEASSGIAAIGIDVGGTNTKGGIVARDGTILSRSEWPTDTDAGTSGIIAVATELSARAEGMGLDISGLGVGAAGFVDARRGAVTFSPNIRYEDPEIASALQRVVVHRVFVDNDANAAVWGERAFGAARGCDDVVMLTVGTGLGGGLICEGRVLRGATGAASEVGHIVIEPGGPACPCGLEGCLEQFVSGNAIARIGRETARDHPDSRMVQLAGRIDGITAAEVSQAAGEGDKAALYVMQRAGRALGVGMSNLVNLFDPEIIVLGGGVIKAGEPLLGPARDQLNAMLLAQRRRPQRLAVAQLRNDAGLVGAAALAFHTHTEQEAMPG